MARAGTMVFVFMLPCQQMASAFQRGQAKVAWSLLRSIWSHAYTKKPHKNWSNLTGRFFRSKELDTSGLRCQRSGMLKEQISGLLGDKILDQSFQNGNFSPKPNLTQEYLTSTWRSPLRESHVTNISWYYKFPQKIWLLHIKLIGLVDHWHLHSFFLLKKVHSSTRSLNSPWLSLEPVNCLSSVSQFSLLLHYYHRW